MAPWNTPRKYTVPGELVKAGRNTIAVRVASTVSIALDGGFMGPAEDMYWQTAEGSRNSLAAEWAYSPEQLFGQDAAMMIPVAGPGLHNTVSTLFENKIYPILPYAIRSVVWYQGECNAIPESDIYDTLLTTLIKDWRYQFCDPQLDFVVIQLPGWQARRRFSIGSTWAVLREKQFQAALANDAAIIVTADTGDVTDLHPQDKDIVAERAAAVTAEKLASGKYPAFAVPLKAERAGDNVKVTVAADILAANEGNGFAIVDVYGEVTYPEFTVSGNTVILSADGGLPERGTVYYNWSNFPEGRITDGGGRMLTGFRLEF
jgi:sialate O-acetylesterase